MSAERLAWLPHQHLAYENGYSGDRLVACCCRTMSPEVPFAVFMPGCPTPVASGDTSDAAKALFEGRLAGRLA